MNKITLFAIALISAFVMNWSAATAKDAAKDTSKDTTTTQVKSYTKKDGTVVKGYSRTKKATADSDTQTVKGYTKKDGTVVAGYTRKKTTKTTTK